MKIIIQLILLLVLKLVNTLNYIKLPNEENHIPINLDEEYSDDYEASFHLKNIKDLQVNTKETVCISMIRNFLTSVKGQKKFTYVLKLLVEEHNKEIEELGINEMQITYTQFKLKDTNLNFKVDFNFGFDMLKDIILKKCNYSIPLRTVIKNLNVNEILNLSEEDKDFMEELVDSSSKARFRKKIKKDDIGDDVKIDL